MANICKLTWKRPVAGQTRSHSMRAGKRWFKPNLITKNLKFDGGLTIKVKLSSRIYKKIVKLWNSDETLKTLFLQGML